MVLSIEAKRQSAGQWEVYTDCGREKTGLNAVDWARRGVELGAGEILLTSIDCEGTRKGFDNQLVQAVSQAVDVPVVAGGGYGQKAHLDEVVQVGADAVAFADVLHYGRTTFADLRIMAGELNIPVRDA